MSYCQHMLQENFRINREHLLKDAMLEVLSHTGFETLHSALWELGFEAETNEEGDVTGLTHHRTECSTLECNVFYSIAPFVVPGSYITLIGENDFIHQWYFNGKEAQFRNHVRIIAMPNDNERAHVVYTDIGENFSLVSADGEKRQIGRYGVWCPSPSGKYECAFTFDNLEDLKKVWGDIKCATIERSL